MHVTAPCVPTCASPWQQGYKLFVLPLKQRPTAIIPIHTAMRLPLCSPVQTRLLVWTALWAAIVHISRRSRFGDPVVHLTARRAQRAPSEWRSPRCSWVQSPDYTPVKDTTDDQTDRPDRACKRGHGGMGTEGGGDRAYSWEESCTGASESAGS